VRRSLLKKSNTEPFKGETEGVSEYNFRRGKKHGPFVRFHEDADLFKPQRGIGVA